MATVPSWPTSFPRSSSLRRVMASANGATARFVKSLFVIKYACLVYLWQKGIFLCRWTMLCGKSTSKAVLNPCIGANAAHRCFAAT